MKKEKIQYTFLLFTLFLSQINTVYGITEKQVESVGKEKASGSILIWFLCAVAFLKISQKIDSFVSGLGINVGQTGSSLLSEAMIAGRSLSSVKNFSTGGFSKLMSGSSHQGGSSLQNASFLSGGLVGAVGRQFTKSAMNSVTNQNTSNPVSSKMFQSSASKGGDFANNITSAVAKGNINQLGAMTGEQASGALTSYMGFTGIENAPSFSNVEIGGGHISGIETSVENPNGTAFSMYNTDQYMEPNGKFDTATATDNSTWYRQYAQDAIEKTPYMMNTGKIGYHEKLIQKVPDAPKRKDGI